MPDNAPTATTALLPAITQDLFCQRCGYNLRGLTGNRCPECGGSLDGVRSLTPQIPWMYRKEIGWWRAYWRTIRFVMFRQAQFCDEMARPVSYRDSQSFRWLTVILLSIPSALPLAASYLICRSGPSFNDPILLAIVAGWPLLIFYACWLLFLAAATGVPSYFFHPRDVPIQQQNRAVALSYYACGPLAFLTVPLLTCAVAILTSTLRDNIVTLVFIVLTFTLPVAAIVPWWFDLIHLARRLVPQKPGRAVAVAVYVPILWLLLAGLILVGLPLVVLGVVLVFANLS